MEKANGRCKALPPLLPAPCWQTPSLRVPGAPLSTNLQEGRAKSRPGARPGFKSWPCCSLAGDLAPVTHLSEWYLSPLSNEEHSGVFLRGSPEASVRRHGRAASPTWVYVCAQMKGLRGPEEDPGFLHLKIGSLSDLE